MAVVLALVLAGCAGGEVEKPVIDAAPDDPLRTQLEWFASVLESGSVTEEEYLAHVTETFADRAPFEESFLPVLADMSRAAGEWHLLALETESDVKGEGVLAAAGERMRVLIEVEPVPPYRIVDLVAQPVMLTLPPLTLTETVDQLRRYGEVGLLAAGVEDGVCVPRFDQGPVEPVPVAGNVDLLVALVVSEQVQTGALSWDDQVGIDPDLMSHPASATSRMTPGSEMTVEELLLAGVGRGDNTALDHLMATVGVDAVETAYLKLTGNTGALPFLTTGQMAALKIGNGRELLDDYATADQTGRREILADLTPDLSSPRIAGEPLQVARVEWFFDRVQLCRLIVGLDDLAGLPGMEPLATALTHDQGPAPVDGTWDELIFSGGSEPGVLSVVWLVRRDDQRLVLVGSVVNPAKAFPTIDAVLNFASARDMLSTESSGPIR